MVLSLLCPLQPPQAKARLSNLVGPLAYWDDVLNAKQLAENSSRAAAPQMSRAFGHRVRRRAQPGSDILGGFEPERFDQCAMAPCGGQPFGEPSIRFTSYRSILSTSEQLLPLGQEPARAAFLQQPGIGSAIPAEARR